MPTRFLFTLTFLCLPGFASSTDTPAPNVEFVDISRLGIGLLKAKGDKSTARFSVTLRNSGSVPALIVFSALLQDAGKVSHAAEISPRQLPIEAQGTEAFSLELRVDPADVALTGQLVARIRPTTAQVFTSVKTRELATTAARSKNTQSAFVIWIMVLSGAAIIVAFVWSIPRLFESMGKPDWKFDSWASNVNVFAGLLTTLSATTSVFEAPTLFTRAGYLALAAMFAVLTGLAPTVYSLLRLKSDRGLVLGFEIAALLTLCGAQGQLLLLICAVKEISFAGTLDPTLTLAFQIAIGAAIASLLVYGNATVLETIKNQAGVKAVVGASWKLL